MVRKLRWCTLIVVAFLTSTAVAAELRSVTLKKEDGRYIASSEVWLDANHEQVFAVLSDWDISTRFSSLITESRNLPADADGRPGFYMKNKGCVLFFCKTVDREGYVVLDAPTSLRAVALADKSDFEESDERWLIEPENDGTRIRYEMIMRPKFWIPPVVGPYAIKRKIRKDGLEALERIEKYVQELDASGD